MATVTLSELVALVTRLEGQTRSPRQVRYLESFGVLPPRGRTEGGVRLYDAADVALVCLIVRMRAADANEESRRRRHNCAGKSGRRVSASLWR